MQDLSNAETALLGLLSEEPRYPYQIEQEVKFRDMRFWTDLSMSSIYKLLRKLEREKLVESTKKITPQNRVQKIYSLSSLGKAVLKNKIEALLSSAEHIRYQVDIGVYNCDLLSKEKIRKALNKYRADLEIKIKGYRELREFLDKEGCPKHRFALAERPVFLLEAEIKWVDSFLEDL